MVDAEEHEGRLAVAEVGIRRYLDADHRAALPGLEGQGDRPRDVRVLLGELLEVVLVIREMAVAGATARERRDPDVLREGAIGRAVALGLCGEVLDLRLVGELALAQLLHVGGTVEQNVHEAAPGVLGVVEAELPELGLAGAVRGDHAHQRTGGRLACVDRLGAHLDRGLGAAAVDPAGLDHDTAGLRQEALGDLARPERRAAGHRAAGVGVEHRDVPVTIGAPGNAGGDPTRLRDVDGARGDARAVAELAVDAGALDGARLRHRRVEQLGALRGCRQGYEEQRRKKKADQRIRVRRAHPIKDDTRAPGPGETQRFFLTLSVSVPRLTAR